MEDARWCVGRWRLDYNHYRPHSSLGNSPGQVRRPLTHLRDGPLLRLRLSRPLRYGGPAESIH
ncbi:MAG: transposase [Planctomycetaceae bacterium]|nr:transposase [Planctomycetaceae bacterium]